MDRLLAAAGLSVALAGEPADHVAIEAGLLAHFVETRHPERAALARRLDRWLPDFRAALAATDPSGYFAAAAAALAAAVATEAGL
jgi:TorA maturation chaperone TorD